MAYKHGVYINEIPTSITPTVASDIIPVVFGTAPVNLSKRQAPVNEPVLCYTYAEAVEALGYSGDWSFTLCEFMYSYFALYGASPAILVNVLDPATDKTAVPASDVTLVKDSATLTQGILKPSVVVKNSDGSTTYVLGTDYETNFDAAGNLVIQRLPSGQIAANAKLKVNYDKLNPSGVTAADIIGGIDANGKPTGLELLDQIFPRFRLVPGSVLAPGYSTDSTVAAVMAAKASNINGNFKAMALVDIPTNTVTKYADAPAWKENNNYTSPFQIVGYPKLALGDKQFHLSTQLAGVMAATDGANGGVPYKSPSNQNFQANGAELADGTPVFLGPDQGAYLNGNGIVTALNFIGGWKAWGNRTGTYPGTTDPKDSFIPIRRMMNWIENTIVLSTWQYVDSPITRRLIEAITGSLNLWLNGLSAQGYILGGRVEFLAAENPNTAIMDGTVKFHVYVTPPSPAREIDFIVEYDAKYLSALTAG
ncbi:phage tail sheath family protein [Paenibacillus tyrfis]|uniref:Phage tail protein n=1 Tax=Paenibacillus tyrfis TaxID=1501230 RepID=A0A081NV35_9BACL|nr:phage tail protein [Paenibacillus tyrfis]KEQ22308.1 phage tail protein [Paenibacillus tyrfis]